MIKIIYDLSDLIFHTGIFEITVKLEKLLGKQWTLYPLLSLQTRVKKSENKEKLMKECIFLGKRIKFMRKRGKSLFNFEVFKFLNYHDNPNESLNVLSIVRKLSSKVN